LFGNDSDLHLQSIRLERGDTEEMRRDAVAAVVAGGRARSMETDELNDSDDANADAADSAVCAFLRAKKAST
jgi:hypothetical protein